MQPNQRWSQFARLLRAYRWTTSVLLASHELASQGVSASAAAGTEVPDIVSNLLNDRLHHKQ